MQSVFFGTTRSLKANVAAGNSTVRFSCLLCIASLACEVQQSSLQQASMQSRCSSCHRLTSHRSQRVPCSSARAQMRLSSELCFAQFSDVCSVHVQRGRFRGSCAITVQANLTAFAQSQMLRACVLGCVLAC